jgi:predicted restriction endonuclease
MKFELDTYNRNSSDKDLLDDLIRVAKELGKNKVIVEEYNERGNFHSGTLIRRFGSWSNSLEKAGLEKTKNSNIPDKELFENIEEIWLKLGRQPHSREMIKPLSKFSSKAYQYRYGTWIKALEKFVEYINLDDEQNKEIEEKESNKIHEDEIVFKHTTKRNISERLKVRVLMRDGNKCRLCGVTVTGENIHFDHIKPWSKGGETVLENLQVLCVKHNIAKGNIEYNEK